MKIRGYGRANWTKKMEKEGKCRNTKVKEK